MKVICNDKVKCDEIAYAVKQQNKETEQHRGQRKSWPAERPDRYAKISPVSSQLEDFFLLPAFLGLDPGLSWRPPVLGNERHGLAANYVAELGTGAVETRELYTTNSQLVQHCSMAMRTADAGITAHACVIVVLQLSLSAG